MRQEGSDEVWIGERRTEEPEIECKGRGISKDGGRTVRNWRLRKTVQ
jgi:hypothetical protein